MILHFMTPQPPLMMRYVAFDVVVKFIKFTLINVITAVTINPDLKKNRQIPKFKTNRQKRKHGTIWRNTMIE